MLSLKTPRQQHHHKIDPQGQHLKKKRHNTFPKMIELESKKKKAETFCVGHCLQSLFSSASTDDVSQLMSEVTKKSGVVDR